MGQVCTFPLYNGLASQLLSSGNNYSNKDDKDKELPSLEELEDLFSASIYNHLKPIAEFNKIDSLAKGINIITVPQAIQKLETYITNQDSLIANNIDNISKLWILKILLL